MPWPCANTIKARPEQTSMKTTNRIRHNGGTKSASVQTKTSRKSKPQTVTGSNGHTASVKNDGTADLPYGGAVLSFFGQAADGFLASVPISADQLACLERNAAKSAFSLERYVQLGLSRMLDELEGKINVRGKTERVNEAPYGKKSEVAS